MEALKRFTCEVCFKSFGRKDHLKRHILTHGEKLLNCEQCDKSFSTQEHLRRHRKTHLDNEYQCAKCSAVFAKFDSLKKHIVIHTDGAPFKCRDCDEGFLKSGDLKRHRIIHTNEKHFNCNLCGNIYFRPEHLNRHMVTHISDKPFKCDVCEKTFNRKEHLVKHHGTHSKYDNVNLLGHPLQASHGAVLDCTPIKVEMDEDSAVKDFQECEECGELFFTADEMKQHMQSHTLEDVKPSSSHIIQSNPMFNNGNESDKLVDIKMEVADIEIPSVGITSLKTEPEDHGYVAQVNNAIEGGYLSNLKKEELPQISSHLSTQPQEGTESSAKPEFQCDVCKCFFVSQEFVNKHKEIKHKKYACELCVEKFSSRKHLNLHMKICSISR